MPGRGVPLEAFWVKLDMDPNTRYVSFSLNPFITKTECETLMVFVDLSVNRICFRFVLCVIHSDLAITSVWHVRIGRKTWVQQDNTQIIRDRSCERMGHCLCTWCTVPCGVLVYLRVGRR